MVRPTTAVRTATQINICRAPERIPNTNTVAPIMLKTSKVIRSRNTLCVIRIIYMHTQLSANKDTSPLEPLTNTRFQILMLKLKEKLITFCIRSTGVNGRDWGRYRIIRGVTGINKVNERSIPCQSPKRHRLFLLLPHGN